MDKAATETANLIDEDFFVLVLTKLKHILVNGFYLADEIRYQYSWDLMKSKSQNRRLIMKEDGALTYFWSMGIIVGERIENAFRSQELKARAKDPEDRVWADWDKVDPAYREYEWVMLIHGIDTHKFESQLKQFNLEDNGTELRVLNVQAKSSPVMGKLGKFTAHKDGTIHYENKFIALKPEAKRLVHAMVLNKGRILRYEQIVDVLWNEEHNSEAYIENPNRTHRDIAKRISNIVSEANGVLHGYGDRKYLIAGGETSYKLVI